MLQSDPKDYRDSQTKDISWQQFQGDCLRLAALALEKSKSWGEIKIVVAVGRGGLAPACLMSNALGIRRVEALSVASYEGREQRTPRFLHEPDLGQGEGCLIVDDLVDSGATAKLVRERLPKALYATVYAKPEGLPYIDFYAIDSDQEDWLQFPWDLENDDLLSP